MAGFPPPLNVQAIKAKLKEHEGDLRRLAALQDQIDSLQPAVEGLQAAAEAKAGQYKYMKIAVYVLLATVGVLVLVALFTGDGGGGGGDDDWYQPPRPYRNYAAGNNRRRYGNSNGDRYGNNGGW